MRYRKRKKGEEGITLIALVITIIILLILAGVAIAMLSGENGILKKAAEAKIETEEGQKEEKTSLTTMDLEANFLTSNSKYKCKYGYVTGIDKDEEAENLNKVLDSKGYKLCNIENMEDVADSTIVTTGMRIVKDGKVLARTVIFGDVNSDGKITIVDYSTVNKYISESNGIIVEDFTKIAMDVNHDGKINEEDVNLLLLVTKRKEEINQNQYALDPEKILVGSN